jgi:ubiquinone/menaquinone biosynthesis C-methylase UbiE
MARTSLIRPGATTGSSDRRLPEPVIDGAPRRVFADDRDFSAWNDRMVATYDIERFHDHPSPVIRWIEGMRVRRTLALLAPGRDDRVLEIGCGAGHLLNQLPTGSRFGLDLSAWMLRQARRRLGASGTLLQANAEHLPFRAGAWDRVYCSEVLEHLVSPEAALSEIARVVAAHGVAVVSVPNERLINRLKAMVRTTRLSRLVLRSASTDYAMPDRMDDEWHLHTFDLRRLLQMMPPTLRVARVERVPFGWLPLRYVVRLEPADPVAGPVHDRGAAPPLRSIERQLSTWLAEEPRDRVLDAQCSSGHLARLAPHDYLGLDTHANAIRRARRRHRNDPRKRFLIGDATTVSLPEQWFDVAMLAGGLDASDDARAAATLGALARATRGTIVLAQPAAVSVEWLTARLDSAGLGLRRAEPAVPWRLVWCSRKERTR